jgi:hypothetical protein
MVSKRLALVVAIAALGIAGCAGEAKRSEVAEEPEVAPAETTVATEAKAEPLRPAPSAVPKSDTPGAATGTVLTGILVCDDYLSHYQACHRTLKLFDEEAIGKRYEEISSVLAKDARNASLRDDVAQRCTALEALLQEQLGGRECEFEAAAEPLVEREAD